MAKKLHILGISRRVWDKILAGFPFLFAEIRLLSLDGAMGISSSERILKLCLTFVNKIDGGPSDNVV
jgi:hypothetical protein